MKNMLKKIYQYIRTHIWCRFVILFLIAVLGLAIIFQYYLKNEYYKYLSEKQYLMENAVLENAKESLEFSLKEYINIGAKFATSTDMMELANSLEEGNNIRNRLNLQMLLTTNSRNSNKLVALAIIDKDGLIYQYDTHKKTTETMWSEDNNKILIETYLAMQDKLKGRVIPRYIVATQPNTHPANSALELFHIYFPLIGNGHNLRNVDKVLCLTFRMDVMNQFLESIDSNKLNHLKGYVTNSDGIIICHTNKDLIGTNETEYIVNQNMSNLSRKLSVFDWKINIACDEKAAMKYVNGIYSKGMVIYAAMLLLLVLFLFLIIQWIMKPISKVSSLMQEIEESGKKRKIEIKGEHEIWQLAEQYNKMIDALKEKECEVENHHRKMLASVELQHEAEREAMEAQINGHFVCNTLNMINYEAIEEGNHRVSKLIKRLSNILRYSFDQKCQDVYFYQEFAWTEQYLYLMKSRLEEVFEYEVHIEEGISQFPCCKLFLQPFVENAIVHGFEGKKGGGKIAINAKKDDFFITISVRDNGCGIPDEVKCVIEEIIGGSYTDRKDKVGIGIKNAIGRLYLYYGNKIKVTLITTKNAGTEFQFQFQYE